MAETAKLQTSISKKLSKLLVINNLAKGYPIWVAFFVVRLFFLKTEVFVQLPTAQFSNPTSDPTSNPTSSGQAQDKFY